MRYSLAALALAGLSYAAPQAAKAPTTQPASSCMKTVSGSFQIQVVNVTRKRDAEASLEERQSGALSITLNNGVLKDAQGRTGEIVANRQFQFDPTPQAGAIYTSGWAVCSNGTLVLGNQAVFYQCLSGDFYNLYDQTQGGQCGPIYIQTIGGGAVQSGSVSQQADGQPTAQPGASSRPVSQIGDGQLQATTSAAPRPVSQISDGQIQATTSAPMMMVSQIADGQLQVPTGKPVSQISDGQIQAATSAGRVVSQISDGQIQATTARPSSSGRVVSQISDGQIQATTARPSSSGRVVSQISDGQIQATTARPSSSGRPVTQIADGQLQATTAASNATATAPAVYTGAASAVRGGELFGLAAGVLAVAML